MNIYSLITGYKEKYNVVGFEYFTSESLCFSLMQKNYRKNALRNFKSQQLRTENSTSGPRSKKKCIDEFSSTNQYDFLSAENMSDSGKRLLCLF